MKKPIAVEAAQEFAAKTFPLVVEILCLICVPLVILGKWLDMTDDEMKRRMQEKKLEKVVDNVPAVS